MLTGCSENEHNYLEQSRAEQSRAEQSRASNFELLRIFAMLGIIAYHYVVHGQVSLTENGDFFQRTFLECFSMFGKIGVNLFIMISAYFGIKKRFSVKKLIDLEVQSLFFSWLGIVVGFALGVEMSIRELIKMFVPTISNQYWFITAYLILYLLSPWYNKLLNSLDKRSYRGLLLITTMIWSVIPCVTLQSGSGMNFSQQIWMFVVYAWGAYFARFGIDIDNKNTILLSVVFSIGLIGSVIAMQVCGLKVHFIAEHAIYFRWSNTILAFPLSLLIFELFRKLELRSKTINVISAVSLSVYLLHENPVISKLLWGNICKNWNGFNLMVFSFFIVLGIYFLGFWAHQIYMKFNKIGSKPKAWIVSKIEDSIAEFH